MTEPLTDEEKEAIRRAVTLTRTILATTAATDPPSALAALSAAARIVTVGDALTPSVVHESTIHGMRLGDLLLDAGILLDARIVASRQVLTYDVQTYAPKCRGVFQHVAERATRTCTLHRGHEGPCEGPEAWLHEHSADEDWETVHGGVGALAAAHELLADVLRSGRARIVDSTGSVVAEGGAV